MLSVAILGDEPTVYYVRDLTLLNRRLRMAITRRMPDEWYAKQEAASRETARKRKEQGTHPFQRHFRSRYGYDEHGMSKYRPGNNVDDDDYC